MKILFLSDDFPPQSFGGAGISTYDLAMGLKKAGHEVFVITTCRRKDEAGRIDYQGLKVFKIASDYSAKWRSYLSLYNPPVVHQGRELLKSIRPDIVHVNNIHFYLSYYCFKLAKKYAKAVVFTARDVMSFNFGKLETERYLKNFDGHITWLDQLKQARKRWNPFRNFFIKKYLNYADQIFAVSFALKKALEQNGIKNVMVMHTGTDLSLPLTSEEEIINFKTKHRLIGKKIILFAGRLRGGNKILDVIEKVLRECPTAVLLVAGPQNPYAQGMIDKAKEMGLTEQLIFTGWVGREEIRTVYSSVDIVLVPSAYFDSLPRMVIEAMTAGKPVVGTCYGGASEAIIDGVTGYVVNPLKVSELAEKIIDLLKNPQKAEEFGRAGRKRIEKYFNIDDKISQTISYYQKIINERPN